MACGISHLLFLSAWNPASTPLSVSAVPLASIFLSLWLWWDKDNSWLFLHSRCPSYYFAGRTGVLFPWIRLCQCGCFSGASMVHLSIAGTWREQVWMLIWGEGISKYVFNSDQNKPLIKTCLSICKDWIASQFASTEEGSCCSEASHEGNLWCGRALNRYSSALITFSQYIPDIFR